MKVEVFMHLGAHWFVVACFKLYVRRELLYYLGIYTDEMLTIRVVLKRYDLDAQGCWNEGPLC